MTEPGSSEAMSREELEVMLLGTELHRWLGLRVRDFDPSKGVLELSMPFSAHAERFAGTGQVHGGAIGTLVDVAATYAAVTHTGRRGIPTIDLRVDFLRPAMNTELRARAFVRRAGRSIASVDVEVMDEKGKITAIGRGTFLTAPLVRA